MLFGAGGEGILNTWMCQKASSVFKMPLVKAPGSGNCLVIITPMKGFGKDDLSSPRHNSLLNWYIYLFHRVPNRPCPWCKIASSLWYINNYLIFWILFTHLCVFHRPLECGSRWHQFIYLQRLSNFLNFIFILLFLNDFGKRQRK